MKPESPEPGAIHWRRDLNAAHADSLKSGRPMLLVFGADWCTWCRKMEQTTLAEQNLVEYINRNFVPVHLDLEEDARAAEILEVERIPCSVALSPRADLLGRMVGFVGVQKYHDTLVRIEALHTRIETRLAAEVRAAQSRPSDPPVR